MRLSPSPARPCRSPPRNSKPSTKCYHSGGYAFIDIHIDSPTAYRDKKGNAGRYSLDAKSGRIVFESGTLKPANAKLFNGPKIGLNMDGKSVYSVTCSLAR